MASGDATISLEASPEVGHREYANVNDQPFARHPGHYLTQFGIHWLSLLAQQPALPSAIDDLKGHDFEIQYPQVLRSVLWELPGYELALEDGYPERPAQDDLRRRHLPEFLCG